MWVFFLNKEKKQTTSAMAAAFPLIIKLRKYKYNQR